MCITSIATKEGVDLKLMLRLVSLLENENSFLIEEGMLLYSFSFPVLNIRVNIPEFWISWSLAGPTHLLQFNVSQDRMDEPHATIKDDCNRWDKKQEVVLTKFQLLLLAKYCTISCYV